MDRNAIIQAEYDLWSGQEQNPFYEYPGVQVQAQDVFRVYSPLLWPGQQNPWDYNLPHNGIFAKDAPYSVEAGTITELIAENNVTTVGTPVLGTLITTLDTLWVCTIIYDTLNKEDGKHSIPLSEDERQATVFPNPTPVGEALWIKLHREGAYGLDIYDALGRNLSHSEVQAQENEIIQLQTNHLQSGTIYYLRLETMDSVTTYKILIQ